VIFEHIGGTEALNAAHREFEEANARNQNNQNYKTN
jgi:hypothetical protein